MNNEETYGATDDDRLASYEATIHGLTAAEDRFAEEDFGDWQGTVVDPRAINSNSDDEYRKN